MGLIILFLTLFLRLIMGEKYEYFDFEKFCSDFEVFLIKKPFKNDKQKTKKNLKNKN